MPTPRKLALGFVLLGVACAGDLPARTPPTLNAVEMISEDEIEARVARVGYDAARDRAGERRRWIELELRYPEDQPLLTALWSRYEKVDLILTALEQRQVRTPTSERRPLEERIGKSDAARLRVQIWIRRALASRDEWDEIIAELEAAVAALEQTVDAP
jgi:hypothetical protein